MGEDGKVLSKTRLGSKRQDIYYYLKNQGGKDKIKIAMEAGYNWQYYYRIIEDIASSITLAHPLKTRIIGESKIKTDKIDSLDTSISVKSRHATRSIYTK